MDSFSVTVLIGVTNEDFSLRTTVHTVMRNCRSEDIGRILIVRSKNAAPQCIAAIAELEQAYPWKVFGMVQERPLVGGAVRDGFDTAQTSHILLLPGDLAIDLNAVPLLIKAEKNDPEGIVKTSRWLCKNAFVGYAHGRKILNACAQVFLRILFRTRLTDLTNAVQIMPTSLYKAIDWKELGFPFLLEMVLCPLRLGVRISEIPADCRGREEGASNNSFKQTASYLKTAIRIRCTPRKQLLKSNERSGRFAAAAKRK